MPAVLMSWMLVSRALLLSRLLPSTTSASGHASGSRVIWPRSSAPLPSRNVVELT